MAEAWFHVPDLMLAGDRIALDADEARHAVGSRRLSGGEIVQLFDGRGAVVQARLHIDRGDVTAEILSRRDMPQHMPLVHLACALPKGDRASTMLSMATQLGISSFTPLICTRGIVEPGLSFAQRAQRIMIEACKQSRQGHVPQVRDPATVKGICERALQDHAAIIMAHPCGTPISKTIRDLPSSLVILVGPEGGFTDEEVATAKEHNATDVDLGDSLLRIETAAIAILSYIRLRS